MEGVIMPQAGNIVVKDNANVDVEFTNVQPSSGNLPATYLARAKGASTASQPVIAISAKGQKGSREIRETVRTPYAIVGVDGVTRVQDSVFTEIRTVLPDNVPDAVRAEHCAYVRNSLAVLQVKEAHETGYAPS